MPAMPGHYQHDYEPRYEFATAGVSYTTYQPTYTYALGGNGSNATHSNGGLGGGGGAQSFDGSTCTPRPQAALAWLDAEIEKTCRLAR